MIDLTPERIAAAIDGEIVVRGSIDSRPERASIDSRSVVSGDLFFGLAGENVDGGRFAGDAIAAGAWGAVLSADAAAALHAAEDAEEDQAWVFAVADPLRALQVLAREWRRELGCPLVGVTGSTGKTSVKDITWAILPARVHASPENFNTEIGMPLALLAAPPETEVLVMEMAMRGVGQIAELCEIAEPDVAAITNVGPVHLELLGTIEAIAEAKAEILAGLGPESTAVLPADAEALQPHLADSVVRVFTFGSGGDVFAVSHEVVPGGLRASIEAPESEGPVDFEFPFDELHNLSNALCAIAIGVALGYSLDQMAPRAANVSFSRLRGEKVELEGGILLLNDCYNANPISMRAAIENLAGRQGERKLAILGGMAELGPDGPNYHAEIGALARDRGIEVLIGIGDLARDYAPDVWAPDPESGAERVASMLRPGDVALVKASRSVGLERLTDALRAKLGREGAAHA